MFKPYEDLAEVLLTQDQIARRVREMGEQISRDYEDQSLLVVGVLKGAVVFYADLIRNMTVDCELDFLKVSSYGNSTNTSGEVKMMKDLDVSIEGRHVLVVEDILDTGVTLSYLMKVLGARNPASLKLCVFLDKPERRKADIHADYIGFSIPDKFVVGYGLDYAQRYRALPDLGVLKEEIYQK